MATICMTRVGKTSRDQRWNNGTSGHSDTEEYGKDLLHTLWGVTLYNKKYVRFASIDPKHSSC
jgi:hypothetical protein